MSRGRNAVSGRADRLSVGRDALSGCGNAMSAGRDEVSKLGDTLSGGADGVPDLGNALSGPGEHLSGGSRWRCCGNACVDDDHRGGAGVSSVDGALSGGL